MISGGIRQLAGADEAGRGCLAGPVVAACVVIPPDKDADFPLVADSKTLTPPQREKLFDRIAEQSLCWSVAEVAPQEIDRLNIHHASLLAMKEAVKALPSRPDYLLIDGRFALDVDIAQEALIDGDARCQSIAAASIMAKVWRDRIMLSMHEHYPQFRFDRHKGYGTLQHREELKRHGPTPIHRLTFKGVKYS